MWILYYWIYLIYIHRLIQGTISEQVKEQDSNCSSIFVPEINWKPILDHQSIPPGIHVRLNLQTGLKEGKLLEELNPNKVDLQDVILVDSALENQVQTQLETQEKDKIKISYNSQERSMLTLQEKKDLDLLMDKLTLDNTTTLHQHLQFLAEIVHDIFVGTEVAYHTNGIDRLFHLMKHKETLIRLESTLVMGNILSNNPASSEKLYMQLLPFLLSCIQSEKDSYVKNRLLYTLGHLIRSNQIILKAFYESKGVQILHSQGSMEKDSCKASCKSKISRIFTDILDPGLYSTQLWDGKELLENGYWTLNIIEYWCPLIDVLKDTFQDIKC